MTQAPVPAPLHLGPPERPVFAVLHATAQPPRAQLLLCPPILNEHARSYRLFSVLARHLAAQGIAVLRFDYYGTGDSGGDDDAFTLGSACDDAMLASAHLADVAGSVPAFVMGVRAGGLVAIETASRTRASGGLVLWQPIADWTDYLRETGALDARQRAAIPAGHAISKDTLMGFALSKDFHAHTAGMATWPGDGHVGRTIVIGDDAAPVGVGATTIPAPPSLTRWTGQAEMGTFPNTQIRDVAAALAGAMGVV